MTSIRIIPGSEGSDGFGGASQLTHTTSAFTVPAGNDKQLIAVVGIHRRDTSVSSTIAVEFGGQPMTEIATQPISGSQYQRLSMFRFDLGNTTPTAGLTVKLSAASRAELQWFVIENCVQGAAADSSFALGIGPDAVDPAAYSLVIDAAWNGALAAGSSLALVPNEGQTLVQPPNHSGVGLLTERFLGTSYEIGSGTRTLGWTATRNAQQAHIVAAFAGVGGPGGGLADPNRFAITVAPQDGSLAGQEILLDSSQATLLDSTTPVRGGVQYRWALPPLNLGEHPMAPGPQDILQFYLTYIEGGEFDGRYEVIARIPFKTYGEGHQNYVGRTYRWRLAWDGQPVELYPNDPDPEQRFFPWVGTGQVVPNGSSTTEYRFEGHTRGTGWRWASRKIGPDWTKLKSLMDDHAVMAHNDTFGIDTTVNPDGSFTGGYDAQGLGWSNPAVPYPTNKLVTQEGQIRYGQPVVYQLDATGSVPLPFSSYVGDVPRDQNRAGDRECIGWEMMSAAKAIVFHRKGDFVNRDNAWKRYQAICDAIEQFPNEFFWNASAHRPLRYDDTADISNPYHTYTGNNVRGSNPNFIEPPVGTNWGRSQVDTAHLHGYGPTAYLLTEDPYYLELTQMLGMFAAIFAPGSFKQKSRPHVTGDFDGQERAWAWSIRALNRAWKATPSTVPSTRFITKQALDDFQLGTRNFINDILNHLDTSGDGLPFAVRQEICGTPARVYGVLRRSDKLVGTKSTSPYAGVSKLCRQTSIFMMDYIGITVGMALLGGATAFQDYANKIANGIYKIRANTGGGFFIPYGIPSDQPDTDAGGDQGIRDGAILYLVDDAEPDEDNESVGFLASTTRFDPANWKAMYSTHGIKGPNHQYLFTADSQNGYLDWVRLHIGYGAFKMLAKAQAAGKISSDVDYGSKLVEMKNAMVVSPTDLTPMPRNATPQVKWMMD